MDSKEILVRQRQQIVDQIAALKPMRMGSVTQQFLPTRHKDGAVRPRGPYFHYTFKRGKKTCGKHLRDEQQAGRYREQIEAFRRYQALSAELVAVSQRLADWDIEESDSKKNSCWTSKLNSRPRRTPSSRR